MSRVWPLPVHGRGDVMCYRDLTYCSEPCGTPECSRRLTPEIKRDAERVRILIARGNLAQVCGKWTPPRAPSGEGSDKP